MVGGRVQLCAGSGLSILPNLGSGPHVGQVSGTVGGVGGDTLGSCGADPGSAAESGSGLRVH